MPTTDEELAKKAEHVQRLREQVAAAQAQRVSREAEVSNDITAAQLDAEEVRLQAQLDAAKHESKVASVKSGAAIVLDTIKGDKANAEAFAKAQEAALAASSAEKVKDEESETPDDTKEV